MRRRRGAAAVAACVLALALSTMPAAAQGGAPQDPASPAESAPPADPAAPAQPPAAEQDPAVPPEPVDPIQEVIRAIAVRDQVIRALIERLQALEQEVRRLQGLPAQAGAAGADPAAAPAPASASGTVTRDQLALDDEERREQERLIRTAFERTLIDRGGLLLRPRTMEVELGFGYIHNSSDRIVIDGFTILPVLVVGDIFNERIRQDVAQGTLALRAGLPRHFQAEIRVPYGYQHRRIVSAENEETSIGAGAFGDLELGISHQILVARGRLPDVLATVRWKTTTGDNPFDVAADRQTVTAGTGYHTVSAGLTMVRVSDPAVLFSGVTYAHSLPTQAEIGRFEPGNAVGFQLGLALALNLDTSVSFAYDQSFRLDSRIDGVPVPGSFLTTGLFSVGMSSAIGRSMTLDFTMGIGVTADSPDIQVGIRLPYRFGF